MKKEIVFMRLSLRCRKAFLPAYSSAKTDSLKKDRAPTIERSIYLCLDNYWSPFLVNILPINKATTTIIAMPTTADII